MKYFILEKFIREAFVEVKDSRHIDSNQIAEIASADTLEWIYGTNDEFLKYILIYTMLVYNINPKYDSNTVNTCIKDFVSARTEDELIAAVHNTIDQLNLPVPKC